MNKDHLFIYVHPESLKSEVVFFGIDHEDNDFVAPTLNELCKYDSLASWLHGMPEGSQIHLADITLTVSNNNISFDCDHSDSETLPIAGTDETYTICHKCGEEL
jgi:hypothetical protein